LNLVLELSIDKYI